ncbi:helix-turn-helix domain-containing protein [Alteribacter natronophilus]|uniref:helix-turn-helix domain-containing protein n=1 Tax=Alteribacter natronophilus TaxID=2583810 RepID=UPI001485D861|nr:helix-turn-helix domain-containing protein [Alteribacter natronophilus]
MLSLLIADRDPEECRGLQWFAERAPFDFRKVTSASTGAELSSRLQEHSYNIVIIELDMFEGAMPESVLSRLHALQDVQIIAISAEATYEKAREALALGALDLLIKPHPVTRLQALLGKAVQSCRRAEPSPGEEKLPARPAYTYTDLFTRETAMPVPQAAMAFTSASPDDVQELSGEVRRQFHTDQVSVLTLSDSVICLAGKKPDELLPRTRNVLTVFSEKCSGTASAVVYQPAVSLSPKEIYSHLKEMLHMTFYEGYHQLFSFTGPITWKKIDPFLTPSEQRVWVDMLLHGHTDRIQEWLYCNFLNSKQPYPEPKLVRTRLTSVLAQVRRYMRMYHLDSGENESAYQELYEDILSGPTVFKTVQNLHLFIQSTIGRVKRRQGVMDPIERGLLYMESRFSDPGLTLEKVSSEVGRNPFYFSEQLSKQTGSGFRATLTAIRIREAKRLLADRTLTIKEIAAGCGFQSSNYFSRKFKEREGLTPKAYRLSLKEKKEKETDHADQKSR